MSECENTLGKTLRNLRPESPQLPESYDEFIDSYGATAMRFYLQALARDLLPSERVSFCWQRPAPAREVIDVVYSDAHQRARVHGVMRCGSLWVCAVCQRFIAETRRIELSRAIENARDVLFVVMVTYTARHDSSAPLAGTLSGMLTAFRALKSGRYWQDVKVEWFLEGSVRALEITWGEDNGWHPHFHELIFASVEKLSHYYGGDIKRYAQTLQTQLRPQWREHLKAVGLTCDLAVGLTVRSTDSDVADYVAKWGKMPAEYDKGASAYEIASAPTKRARMGRFGPLELLFKAGNGDARSKALFIEYAKATRGKSALQWSRGLKARLHIDEIRDQVASEGLSDPNERLLARVNIDLWQAMARVGFLGQLMTIANRGSEGELKGFLDQVAQVFHIEVIDLKGL